MLDRLIGALAAKQAGYVLREQLIALGLTAGAIEHRIKRGLLIPVHHGVYAVGHVPADPRLRARGALLATGDRSALAYESALSAWTLKPRWREPFEVIVVERRRPKGIVMHQSSCLLTRDVRTRNGLRVTSPALTVLHNAPRLTDKRLIRAVNELRTDNGLTHEQLVDVVTRFARHKGARRVRELFGVTVQQPDRSPFEEGWRAFALTYKFTGWATNQVVCGHRVDVLFVPDLVIVELDGWGTHGTKPAFGRDREQDADILDRTGIPTNRIPRDSFEAQPERHAARIHRLLNTRRAQLNR